MGKSERRREKNMKRKKWDGSETNGREKKRDLEGEKSVSTGLLEIGHDGGTEGGGVVGLRWNGDERRHRARLVDVGRARRLLMLWWRSGGVVVAVGLPRVGQLQLLQLVAHDGGSLVRRHGGLDVVGVVALLEFRHVQPLVHLLRDGLNLRVQFPFDAVEIVTILVGDEVDGHAEMAKPARSTNPVEVGLSVARKVKVDYHIDSLDVDAAREEVWIQKKNPPMPWYDFKMQTLHPNFSTFLNLNRSGFLSRLNSYPVRIPIPSEFLSRPDFSPVRIPIPSGFLSPLNFYPVRIPLPSGFLSPLNFYPVWIFHCFSTFFTVSFRS